MWCCITVLFTLECQGVIKCLHVVFTLLCQCVIEGHCIGVLLVCAHCCVIAHHSGVCFYAVVSVLNACVECFAVAVSMSLSVSV